MKYKTHLPIAFAVVLFTGMANLFAQSSLFVRNSSWLDFEVSMVQLGSAQTQPTNYTLHRSDFLNWEEDAPLFSTDRGSLVVPMGDSVIYQIQLKHGSDRINMDMKLLNTGNGTSFASRLHGSGFDTGWSADGNFHGGQVTIAGRPLELKYKADNDDSQQNMSIRLAIHESEIYTIDPSDFSNPNVLNVMAYNIQMLPLGLVGMPQASDRGNLLPAQFSPYQDVVIFEEAFDPLPRLFNLIPAMQAAGFAHNSGILNDYLPFNGGVIIFSRWPIERTDQYDFELCGPNSQDCLSNKGIMYARILKLGKPYNVFGTHFDAGSDSADIAAKTLQYAEMRDFIEAQGISDQEAVIWGGDLNTDAGNSSNLLHRMLDSLDIVVPDYTGFFESNMSRDTGEVIDHVFADPRFLLPVEAGVFITTFRSLSPVLWDLSDFSDHRSAIARFRFPDLSAGPNDQLVCPGQQFSVSSTADINLQRTWLRDGSPIVGFNGATYTVLNSTVADSGLYAMEFNYSRTYGTGNGPIDQLMRLNGPSTYTYDAIYRAGNVNVHPTNCANALANAVGPQFIAYPNPTAGGLQLERTNSDRLTWMLVDGTGILRMKGIWTGTQMQLDLTGLAAGIYHLQMLDRSGNLSTQHIQLTR